MLLAAQVAAVATIEAQAQLCEVRTEYLGLANADGRQHIVVVCAEGGLAMPNQVDAAHVLVSREVESSARV
ncbi:hypothetical protein D3C73_1664020 [compost metagenome]